MFFFEPPNFALTASEGPPLFFGVQVTEPNLNIPKAEVREGGQPRELSFLPNKLASLRRVGPRQPTSTSYGHSRRSDWTATALETVKFEV